MGPTYRPRNRRRINKQGFRARMNDRWGRAVLSRRPRLGRGTELTACWEEGRKLRTPSLDLAWRANQAGHPRLGIVVPRFQQTAVARNRLRRRLREVLRCGPLLTLPPVDLVVRAKRTAYAASFAVLRAELTEATARIA